jgi:hypothetical protein
MGLPRIHRFSSLARAQPEQTDRVPSGTLTPLVHTSKTLRQRFTTLERIASSLEGPLRLQHPYGLETMQFVRPEVYEARTRQTS